MKEIYTQLFLVIFPIMTGMSYLTLIAIWFFGKKKEYAIKSLKLSVVISLILAPVGFLFVKFDLVNVDMSQIDLASMILFIAYGYASLISSAYLWFKAE